MFRWLIFSGGETSRLSWQHGCSLENCLHMVKAFNKNQKPQPVRASKEVVPPVTGNLQVSLQVTDLVEILIVVND